MINASESRHPFLIELQRSAISISEMQHAFVKILRTHQRDVDFWDRRLKFCLDKKKDYIFWREDFGGRDITVSFLYLEPGEVHPPHHHNNVISVQSVAAGQIWAREYHRIKCIDEDKILISSVNERLMDINDEILAHEWSRNVHWFAATSDKPAVMWNCNVRGFETKLFLNPSPKSLGRILLDPHFEVINGMLLARNLSVEEAYDKFGGKPISNWPIPRVWFGQKFELMNIGYCTLIFCLIVFVTGFENLTFANSNNLGATKEKAKNANYDRTTLGMKKRFLCLREHVDDKGIEDFPSNREIDTFIENVTQLEFISASSVTSGTDTKKISHFQLHKLGLSKTSIATHKKSFRRFGKLQRHKRRILHHQKKG